MSLSPMQLDVGVATDTLFRPFYLFCPFMDWAATSVLYYYYY
jgi:hypothetical protein